MPFSWEKSRRPLKNTKCNSNAECLLISIARARCTMHPRGKSVRFLLQPFAAPDWKRIVDLWPYILIAISICGLLYRWWRS